MVVLELLGVGELWELLVVSVVVVNVDSFVSSLVFFGREGGKYIAESKLNSNSRTKKNVSEGIINN
jgi:hypothetical protein